MHVELNDIAMFVEVAKTLSFTKAADALDTPAATLSRRITQLEQALNVKLLVRSTRHLDLTPEGAAYYERCANLVATARSAHEQLLDMASQPAGRVSVSMPVSFALFFLPDVLDEFLTRYPDIQLDFDLGMTDIDAIENPFDLVLRFGEQPDSTLISKQLALVSHQLYASPAYLAEHGIPLQPADLSHHQCLRPVIDSEMNHWALSNGNRQVNVPVTGRMAANSIGLCANLAMQGLGVTLLPVFASMKRAVSDASLKRVLPEWEHVAVPLYALIPTRVAPAKTRALMNFIQEKLAPSSAQGAALSKLQTE